MVESINQRIKDGLEASKAVFEGATSRLRPVLMTSVTTFIALIPMAMDKTEGANLWSPLAKTVIGGLIVSTPLGSKSVTFKFKVAGSNTTESNKC